MPSDDDEEAVENEGEDVAVAAASVNGDDQEVIKPISRKPSPFGL